MIAFSAATGEAAAEVSLKIQSKRYSELACNQCTRSVLSVHNYY
jgi:predicted nucleic-acid-binding Zn-ribbon protein